MPYKGHRRKSTRGDYGLSVLQEAVAKVQNGELSKKKAEKIYGVPRRTLSRHIKGEVRKPGNLGRFGCIFSTEFEEAIVMHAVKLQRMLFGLSTMDLRKLAFDIAENQKIPNSFKNGMTGKGWLRGFMVRNPDLCIRSPEPTSLSRAVGFNRPRVDAFYKLYQEQLVSNNFTPDRIFNVDETGLTAVHKPGRILAKKGDKQVGKITSAEKGETMTVLMAMSASGIYVPPMLIFKRRRMNDLLLRGSPAGTIAGCSQNGWVDSDLFLKWMQHFIDCVKATQAHKVLLILDGHCSHKSLDVIDLAHANGVVIICLPPHTTHRMQPLDLTVFGPLKKYYNRECEHWMLSNPGKRITVFDQAGLFGSAYIKTATMDKAVNGFRSPGLWPYDPDQLKDDEFLPSMVTDEPAAYSNGSLASGRLIKHLLFLIITFCLVVASSE